MAEPVLKRGNWYLLERVRSVGQLEVQVIKILSGRDKDGFYTAEIQNENDDESKEIIRFKLELVNPDFPPDYQWGAKVDKGNNVYQHFSHVRPKNART